MEQLAPLKNEEIVYADESGMDHREDYGYGYSPQGERFHDLKSGRRTGRVNMIAALCGQQILAPFTIEGACNRQVFETWLETCLIPTLKPGQKLVIDNATFHKGGRIEALPSNKSKRRIKYILAPSQEFRRFRLRGAPRRLGILLFGDP